MNDDQNVAPGSNNESDDWSSFAALPIENKDLAIEGSKARKVAHLLKNHDFSMMNV